MATNESVKQYIDVCVKSIREISVQSQNPEFLRSCQTALGVRTLPTMIEALTEKIWSLAQAHHGTVPDPDSAESSTLDFDTIIADSMMSVQGNCGGHLVDSGSFRVDSSPGAEASIASQCSQSSNNMTSPNESSQPSTQDSLSQTDSDFFDELLNVASSLKTYRKISFR